MCESPRTQRLLHYEVLVNQDPMRGVMDLDVTVRWTYQDAAGLPIDYLFLRMDAEEFGCELRQPVTCDGASMDQVPAPWQEVQPNQLFRLDLPKPLYSGHIATFRYNIHYELGRFQSRPWLSSFFPRIVAPTAGDGRVFPFASFVIRFAQPPSAPIDTTMNQDGPVFREDDVTCVALAFDGPSQNVVRLLAPFESRGLPWLRSRVVVRTGDYQSRGCLVWVDGSVQRALVEALMTDYGITCNDSELDAFTAWFFESENSFKKRCAEYFRGKRPTRVSQFGAVLNMINAEHIRSWRLSALSGRLHLQSARQWLEVLGFVNGGVDPELAVVRLRSQSRHQWTYSIEWHRAEPKAFLLMQDVEGSWHALRMAASEGVSEVVTTWPIQSISSSFSDPSPISVPVQVGLQRKMDLQQKDQIRLQTWIRQGFLL